jgi:hypothetical protein
VRPLTRADLLPLESYAAQRSEFRARVMAHKANRRVALGPHVTLHFEDRLTIQYQIQEMLRVERIFEPAGIADELAAYNPLIPDGANLKATLLIEYENPDERRVALGNLIGIEDRVWLRIGGHGRVYAIADEDMDRTRADKTASVHFLRFEFPADQVRAAVAGAPWAAGVDHAQYQVTIDPLPQPVGEALAGDFDPC